MNSTSAIFEIVKFAKGGDFFGPLYELGTMKITLCFSSFVYSILMVPLFVSMIWFDWYGSDMKRIFVHRLVSSLAFTAMGQLNLVQIPEILQYVTGPLPNWFCFWQYVLKNSIAMQEILYLDIITLVRYMFIFSIKNPATFQDEFWNFFINILVVSFSFLSQAIFVSLPGRQPLTYYFCTGDIPSGLYTIKTIFIKMDINLNQICFLLVLRNICL